MTPIKVQGWNLAQFQEDSLPRIHEYELARRLGMARERDIRNPFERLRKAGKFNDSDVREILRSRSGAVRRTDVEHWLSERAALLVIGESNTPKAMDIRVEVMDVYLAVRAGLQPSAALRPTDRNWLLTYPEVDTLKARFRTLAKALGVSATSLWVRARREIGFKDYSIPNALADSLLAWANAQGLARLEAHQKTPPAPLALPRKETPAADPKTDLNVYSVCEEVQKATGIHLKTTRSRLGPPSQGPMALGDHPFIALFEEAGVTPLYVNQPIDKKPKPGDLQAPFLFPAELPTLIQWIRANHDWVREQYALRDL